MTYLTPSCLIREFSRFFDAKLFNRLLIDHEYQIKTPVGYEPTAKGKKFSISETVRNSVDIESKTPDHVLLWDRSIIKELKGCEIIYHTVHEMSRTYNVAQKTITTRLVRFGYQKKTTFGYMPTKKGKQYCRRVDSFEHKRNGEPKSIQLLWKKEIINQLNLEVNK